MSAPRLLAVAAVFHLVYVFSIFDIYFRTPIDSGIGPVHFPDTVKPPAKRLVLIVADGLRADTCFNFLGRDVRYHRSGSSRRDAQTAEAMLEESHWQAAQVTWPTANTSFLRGIIETAGGCVCLLVVQLSNCTLLLSRWSIRVRFVRCMHPLVVHVARESAIHRFVLPKAEAWTFDW
jgi:hypothetical protein